MKDEMSLNTAEHGLCIIICSSWKSCWLGETDKISTSASWTSAA